MQHGFCKQPDGSFICQPVVIPELRAFSPGARGLVLTSGLSFDITFVDSDMAFDSTAVFTNSTSPGLTMQQIIELQLGSWGQTVNVSDFTTNIRVTFTDLGGSGTLASAGPVKFFQVQSNGSPYPNGFIGQTLPSTFTIRDYSEQNQSSGNTNISVAEAAYRCWFRSLNPGQDPPGTTNFDIFVTVNTWYLKDNGGGDNNINFYDVSDSFTNVIGRHSFKNVIVHELYHGLGFLNISNADSGGIGDSLFNLSMFRTGFVPASTIQYEDVARQRCTCTRRTIYSWNYVVDKVDTGGGNYDITATFTGTSVGSANFTVKWVTSDSSFVPLFDFNTTTDFLDSPFGSITAGSQLALIAGSQYQFRFASRTGGGTVQWSIDNSGTPVTLNPADLTSFHSVGVYRYKNNEEQFYFLEDLTDNPPSDSTFIRNDGITYESYGTIFHTDGDGYLEPIENEAPSHYHNNTNIMFYGASIGGRAPSSNDMRALELLGFAGHSPICIHPETIVETLEKGKIPVCQVFSGMHVMSQNSSWLKIENVAKMAASKDYVKIERGALGENLPSKKIRLTPDHPILYEEKLVPVGQLADEKISGFSHEVLDEAVNSYTLITEKKDFVKIEGVDVMTWSKKDFEDRARKKSYFLAPFIYQ